MNAETFKNPVSEQETDDGYYPEVKVQFGLSQNHLFIIKASLYPDTI